MNYLASPPLVVAYALAGTMDIDLREEPLGDGHRRRAGLPPRPLADVGGNRRGRRRRCIDTDDVHAAVRARVRRRRALASPARADGRALHLGRRLDVHPQAAVPRRHRSGPRRRPTDVDGARVLALLGDSVTTDHISPAGVIRRDGPAAQWLLEHDVPVAEFNSYGARRGNHEVMVRGTFAQRAAAKSARARHRRRCHAAPARRRADDDLRRVDALRRRRRAARRARGQGVRLRQLARLGREGLATARRARGDRRVLRTHPSFEPRRDGRVAAAVRGRASRSRRSGSPGTRSFRLVGVTALAEDGPLASHDPVSRRRPAVRDDRPHRHPVRARRVPRRRHPPVHLAASGLRSVTPGRRRSSVRPRSVSGCTPGFPRDDRGARQTA